MSSYQNHAIILNKRPQGEIRDGDLTLTTKNLQPIQSGELLIKTLWLSLDPYMRPHMNEAKSYMEPAVIGEVMGGEVVGRVVKSKSDKYMVGDIVTCYAGWQEYYVAADSEKMMYKVNAQGVPLQAFLGVAGMPGRTGYCGLTHLGKPQSGETVVVSSAAGTVGTVVGQTAKLLGCRTIGIAGGKEKCDYVVNELEFDACIDYKAGHLAEDLKAACPKGIDIYFENVGGDVTRAVTPLLNRGSRVPICGFISTYNASDLSQVETPMHILGALPDPPEHRFFMVTEWQDQHTEITRLLADRIRSGELKYRESIAEGLESAVDAFKGMLTGQNIGKQLVHIAD